MAALPRKALIGLGLELAAVGCLVVAFLERKDVTFDFQAAGFAGHIDKAQTSFAVTHVPTTPWLIAAMILVLAGSFTLARAVGATR